MTRLLSAVLLALVTLAFVGVVRADGDGLHCHAIVRGHTH